jgi:hypothetical protein
MYLPLPLPNPHILFLYDTFEYYPPILTKTYYVKIFYISVSKLETKHLNSIYYALKILLSNSENVYNCGR